ncbi:Sexual differentiation process protein ISP4 [Phaffia rhodozyma]|uniref:Sexual differentiation process protein ISP4 n=1 Tax=Phaffia rhodozyma TaxID=264483 RepID=A0A0F7SLM4_PHARH|nr:Sexual differentiation process protein ISP4 [Phaffia rhodozyma]
MVPNAKKTDAEPPLETGSFGAYRIEAVPLGKHPKKMKASSFLPKYNDPIADGTGHESPLQEVHDSEFKDDPNLEKADEKGVFVVDSVVEATTTEDVEELERRLENSQALDEEYAVHDSRDVAVKVLSTFDDPTLPVLTFRTIFLGLGFSAFGSVLAQIYYFKPQTLSVSTSFLLILTYFFGHAMATILPSRGIFRFLNPGPFNIKEHAAIIIMCSTAAGSATGIQVISVQDLYYNNKMNPGVAIFTLLGSQLLGFGYAGLLQEALVYPTICLWPQCITSVAMFQALHFDGGLSKQRKKVFWIIFAAIFVWEIFPQWIFPWLTGISVICLFSHNNPTTRNIFGGSNNNEGLGLFSICTDWLLIGSSCLYTPLWTQLNQNIGIVFTYILMCSVYYGNIWHGKSFPFMSQSIFTANGTVYPQSDILTDNVFDESKYAAVGPAYFSATNALYLLVENLSLSSTIVHTFLFYWPEIKPFFVGMNPWNKTRFEINDPHFAKMQVYPKIPRWWFLLILLGAFAIAQATDYTGNSGFPWWALLVTIIISFFLACMYSTLAGILGFYQFSSGGTGFFQMLCAFFLPGRPVANMYAALYGATSMSQAILMLQDLKLGQYVKLPPRVTFLMQMLGTIVGAILNYVMMLSIISAQRDALLSVSGTRLWSGQNAQSYNSNAIAWGALGPKMFTAGNTYYMIPVSLGLGLLLPLPIYALHRWKPKFGFNNINPAIIMQYSAYLSVGVNTSVNTSMALGVISQYFVRRRYPKMFTKYNYIVSGAMDGGTQVISFILNFAVFGASGTAHAFPTWWGNSATYSVDRCMAPDS